MAQLDENNKFINQTNLGWTFSFEANGKYPMIANRIFATKADTGLSSVSLLVLDIFISKYNLLLTITCIYSYNFA